LQHLTRFLHELPFFEGLDNFDGTIDISSTEPIVAVTLRLDGLELATVSPITPGDNTTNLPDGAVTTPKLADNAVTGPKIANGAVVRSINQLTENVTLQ